MKRDETVFLDTGTGILAGSLRLPSGIERGPVALIIAGSGPTDRNGNPPGMENNSLKLLAEGLAERGIASLCYDKRGIGESKGAGLPEEAMTMDLLIADAALWISFLRKDMAFSKIVVAGHSEGAMIGMVAAKQEKADAFISIAGPGRPLDRVIREQLSGQPDKIRNHADAILRELVSGKTVADVPDMFLALFRPSVQPYLISLLRLDPAVEMAKLPVPVLILQGRCDLQVKETDARSLQRAKPDARLVMMANMNHVLKEVGTDPAENRAAYTNPALPVMPELIDAVTDFILEG